MRATLTFELPEEQREFDAACTAPQLVTILQQLCNELRRKRKHCDLTPHALEALAEIETWVWERFLEEGVDIDAM